MLVVVLLVPPFGRLSDTPNGATLKECNWVWQFHLFARPLACPSAINNSSNYRYCGASHSQFRRQTWLFYNNTAQNICIFSLLALVLLIVNAMLTQWVRQTQMKEQKKIISWPLQHGLAKHWLGTWTKVSSKNKWLYLLYCLRFFYLIYATFGWKTDSISGAEKNKCRLVESLQPIMIWVIMMSAVLLEPSRSAVCEYSWCRLCGAVKQRGTPLYMREVNEVSGV